VKVWCDACGDYTILNQKKICLWCNTKIPEVNIKKARLESHE
jgi:hypothetical protein